MLKIRGVDVVHIPDGPRGARMSALSLAVLIQQQAWIETVLQYSCRDRNLLGMQSDLLGAHAMGVRNLVLVTGDVRPVGDYPGRDGGVRRRLDRPDQRRGAAQPRPRHRRPGDRQPDGVSRRRAGQSRAPRISMREIRRFEYKVEAGAEFAVTRPVFDVRHVRAAATSGSQSARHADHRRPAGRSRACSNAEFMANEVPGVRVPDAVLERMRRAADGGRGGGGRRCDRARARRGAARARCRGCTSRRRRAASRPRSRCSRASDRPRAQSSLFRLIRPGRYSARSSPLCAAERHAYA